jgi:O-antigen/teichoic acid export membrane protein
MSQLSTTFAASLGARVFTAVLGLLAMPIYLRLLGPDDFGLVGFFLSLQLIVNFLDLGLGTTLVRKLSIHHLQNPELAYCYAKTYEAIYGIIAAVALCLLFSAASWLAHSWLQPQPHQRPDLTTQLRWASVAICVTWMAGIYSCMLMGLERQKRLAWVQSLSALVRFLLPVSVVTWQADLTMFFLAQVAAALAHWLIFRAAALQLMPPHAKSTSTSSQVRWQLIRSDAQFSMGMLGIFVTTFLITQLDKMILSRMLSLAEFGLYTMCITLSGGIYLAVQPLFNLLYPRFSRLLEPESESDAQQLYRLGSQAMALMVLPISASIIAFAPQVLWVWTGDAQVAEKGANVLRLLTLANAINAIMNLPYAIQLAHGWTSLPLKVGCVATVFLVPSMIWSVDRWGILGGAGVVLLVYASIFLLVPQITHSRLLKTEKLYWFKNAVIIPTIICSSLAGAASFFWPLDYDRWQNFAAILLVLVLSTLATLIGLPDLRHRGMAFFRSITQNSPASLTKP